MEPPNRMSLNTLNRSFAISQELLADSFVDLQKIILTPHGMEVSKEQSRAIRMQEIQDEIDSLEYELERLKLQEG